MYKRQLKDDALHDPVLSEEHVRALELATSEQVDEMKRIARTVNVVLKGFLAQRNIDLVDFKLEFGLKDGELVLGDEISPDTCRFHEAATGRVMDKDIFRRDLGGFVEAYEEILDRVSQ